NKRDKTNLDSSLLWHCRLGHINKKRIKKLQHDGLLNSTDFHSFEKCVSCMSGKMARKPYTHQVERATDLLGLIHIDVCGPFRTVSRQGASYFVTFTDDFSRNQLGKTIKSLRSDRGGEYMSQEFLDHLKEHGIIAHHTPLYTPQHNRVSDRRNRTLLDMVRSMMSQTTLLKSFWDYAPESAVRILNMVPTKKVEKTPYESSSCSKRASLKPTGLIMKKPFLLLQTLELLGFLFYMENSKRGSIPMQEKLKLSKSQGASTPAEKAIAELAMLKLYEQTLPKKEVTPALHAIRVGKVTDHRVKETVIEQNRSNIGREMGSSSSKSRVVVTSAKSRSSFSRNVFQDNCIINRSSFNDDSNSDIDDDDVTHHADDEQ
nr:retrotransposon protein, putative, Ty1-copia subclass [Tanacetum cinerariifolium]